MPTPPERSCRACGWPWRLALLLCSIALPAGAAPRIGLVTMEPGLDYWTRFGHNAILVQDEQQATLYNYGYFDFDQPGFLQRFVRGRMLYRLVALPMERDLAGYRAEGRGATLQWLDLPPARAESLAQFLADNARPEHAEYRYDYFTDNCSTKVRDALDIALDGELSAQLRGRSHGYTYRSESRRLSAPLPWMHWGIHLGLGPATDRPLSLWQEGFVPMRLRDAVAELRTSRGPLVSETHQLLPHRLAATPEAPPATRAAMLLLGLACAGALLFATRREAGPPARRVAAVVSALLWLVCGLAGIGLVLLWAATDHTFAWGNENALLFNPLSLLLLPATVALARGDSAAAWMRILALLLALCAGAALFLKFLPFRIQDNVDWIALMLPLHIALAIRLRRSAVVR